jgi:hypothetical protein
VPGVRQSPPVNPVMGNPLSGEAQQFQVSLMLQTVKGLLLESWLLMEAVARHLARALAVPALAVPALEVQALAVKVQAAMVLGMAAARIVGATLLATNSTMPRLKRMMKRKPCPDPTYSRTSNTIISWS